MCFLRRLYKNESKEVKFFIPPYELKIMPLEQIQNVVPNAIAYANFRSTTDHTKNKIGLAVMFEWEGNPQYWLDEVPYYERALSLMGSVSLCYTNQKPISISFHYLKDSFDGEPDTTNRFLSQKLLEVAIGKKAFLEVFWETLPSLYSNVHTNIIGHELLHGLSVQIGEKKYLLNLNHKNSGSYADFEFWDFEKAKKDVESMGGKIE